MTARILPPKNIIMRGLCCLNVVNGINTWRGHFRWLCLWRGVQWWVSDDEKSRISLISTNKYAMMMRHKLKYLNCTPCRHAIVVDLCRQAEFDLRYSCIKHLSSHVQGCIYFYVTSIWDFSLSHHVNHF